MVRRIASFLGIVVVVACSGPAAPPRVAPTPPPPVAATPPPLPPPPTDELPGLRLPRLFTPTAYTAKLAIDPSKPTLDGAIAIDGQISKATRVIWLHGIQIAIHQAVAVQGGVKVALTATPRRKDLIELRADAPLDPGQWQLQLDYTADMDAVATMGAFRESVATASYVFTQFESTGARRAFPCLDEPDSKVPWQLTIDAPKGNLAVANTPAKETALEGGGHRYEFAQTKPLPSYLIAFGVGPFDIVPAGATKSGVPVRIVVPKGRAADAAYAAQTTAKILDLLEDWFGIPYAYGKLDMMAIPLTSGFGAMENAGLVTFAEDYILFDPKHPSWNRRFQWVDVAAHELAHQWFGDLVTTAWWDDIWLNEGFADWMENKIVAKFDPSWHAELEEISIRRGATGADSIVTARRIRQPIETEDDILNAFDGITYNKGASVLNMFESFVGPEIFRTGVRAYLKAKAFGNATSGDFIAAISKVAKRDLAPAFATFLDQAGLPQLSYEIGCDGPGPRVTFTQQRWIGDGSPPAEATKPWIMPVCIAYERNGKRVETCTLLDAPTGTLALDTKTCPRWIAPNVNGRGYYRTDFTVKQATALRDEAWPMLTPAERRVAFGDVEIGALSAHKGVKLPLALGVSFVAKLFASHDRFSVGDATEIVGALDGVYLGADQRPKLEAWLRATFGPAATKLGPLPQPTDDLDAESSRRSLFLSAAFAGRDPDLVTQAIELAKHWRDLPEAMRGSILAVAVDASPALFEMARAAVKTETDVVRKSELLDALAGSRDPSRLAAALAVMLDPAIDFKQSMWMLNGGDQATVTARQQFFRDHKDDLLKRLPALDSTGSSIYAFAVPFIRDCDAARRDEMVDYMTKNLSSIEGAPRRIVQLTENLDRCIAARKVIEPELRDWVSGVKIAKPAASGKKPRPRHE